MNAIECKGVTKTFKDTDKIDSKKFEYECKVALDNMDLGIKKNSITALLGRNGAGKTTLLNCLCTKYIQDSGEIKVLGENPYENDKILKNICFMSDSVASFELKKVKDILKFAAMFYDNWNYELEGKLIDFFEIDIKQLYSSLSKGQKTVIGIIIGLCSRCEVVLLDEIYSGLDAVARNNFYKILMEEFEKNPRTFVLSTHLIEEMTSLFTDVVIMDKGKVILSEEMEVIHEKSFKCVGRSDAEKILSDKNVVAKKEMGTITEFSVYDNFTQQELVQLKENGFTISALSLQELFIALTEEEPKEWRK